ncbi:MAG: hypothetical protein IJQ82_06665 [Selenomonadaceae bacterium]|nr:hypothetical protein [Selenomonadaceae bacterium]
MICKKCGKPFPGRIKIDGKTRNLHTRSYCLKCSPFNSHNTCQLDRPIREGYKCSRCGETDPKKFTKGRYTECKRCRTRYNVRNMRERKERSVQYLGGRCACCGYTGLCNDVFDFHHVNPDNKSKNFTRHLYWSWEKQIAELDKCLLLCSNCHREFHAGALTYHDFKYLPEDKKYLVGV